MNLDTFTTDRLRAERLVPEHIGEIRRMHQDPVVMQSLGGVRDEAETVAYLDRNLRHWADHGFGLWILYERSGDGRGEEPIGRGMLRHLDVDGVDEIEVGYAFYKQFWGRGLATEITMACLALGRRELGRSSFVAVTIPDNVASQRVLQKGGLSFDREIVHAGTTHHLYRTRP